MGVIDDSHLSESALEGISTADLTYISQDDVIFEHISEDKKEPYHTRTRIVKQVDKLYNPKFGDDRVCKCGHSYYRHFDSWDDMFACGCKYCECSEFIEDKKIKKGGNDNG